MFRRLYARLLLVGVFVFAFVLLSHQNELTEERGKGERKGDFLSIPLVEKFQEEGVVIEEYEGGEEEEDGIIQGNSDVLVLTQQEADELLDAMERGDSSTVYEFLERMAGIDVNLVLDGFHIDFQIASDDDVLRDSDEDYDQFEGYEEYDEYDEYDEEDEEYEEGDFEEGGYDGEYEEEGEYEERYVKGESEEGKEEEEEDKKKKSSHIHHRKKQTKKEEEELLSIIGEVLGIDLEDVDDIDHVKEKISQIKDSEERDEEILSLIQKVLEVDSSFSVDFVDLIEIIGPDALTRKKEGKFEMIKGKLERKKMEQTESLLCGVCMTPLFFPHHFVAYQSSEVLHREETTLFGSMKTLVQLLKMPKNKSKKKNLKRKQTVSNPSGAVFHMLTANNTISPSRLFYLGEPKESFSWFPGYTWRVMICAKCHQHIGWLFEPVKEKKGKRREEKEPFFGIVLDHMLEASQS